jgi:hypothetical protein
VNNFFHKNNLMRILKSNRGFLLVEALLALALLSLLFVAFTGAFFSGQESTAIAGARIRANFLAEEGLEIVRNMRDADFLNLQDGTHGLAISSNQWIFSSTSDTSNGFTRQLQISTIDANKKQITSNISWQQNQQRNGLISLNTYLTNWQEEVETSNNQSDALIVNIDEAKIGGGGKRELQGITIENISADESAIIIDKITLTWNNGKLIEEIKIENEKVWKHNGSQGLPKGKQATGTELDIEDYELAANTIYEITRFRFDSNMIGDTFTITFELADGSTKTVNVRFAL